MNRPPMYIAHGPGEVISRASGFVYDMTDAMKTARTHLEYAVEHPDASSAEAHRRLAGEMAAAIREARSQALSRPVEEAA